MIIFHRYLWRITLKLVHPAVANVHIERIAIAIELPNARHWHLSPSAIIVAHLVEVRRPLVCILHPKELPSAVQRHEVGAGLLVSSTGLSLILVSEEVGMHRQSVHRIHLRILPLIFLSVERQA